MNARFPLAATTVLLSSYFVLWACAPMVTMPGPAPLTEDRPNELGLAAVGAVGHPTTAALVSGQVLSPDLSAFYGGQAWYRRRVSRVWDLGGTLGGGSGQGATAGVFARARLYDRDAFSFGLQLGGGLVYADLGVYVAGALSDRLWLYASPTAGYRVLAPGRFPIGLQWRITDTTSLDAEAGVGFPAGLDGSPWDPKREMYWLGLGVDFRL